MQLRLLYGEQKQVTGVIVIGAKKGGFNKKLQVNFNASSGISSIFNLNEYNNLNSTDAIAVEQFLFASGYSTSQENSPQKPLSPAVELFIANRDGKLGNKEMELQLAAMLSQDMVLSVFVDNWCDMGFLRGDYLKPHLAFPNQGSSLIVRLKNSGIRRPILKISAIVVLPLFAEIYIALIYNDFIY